MSQESYEAPSGESSQQPQHLSNPESESYESDAAADHSDYGLAAEFDFGPQPDDVSDVGEESPLDSVEGFSSSPLSQEQIYHVVDGNGDSDVEEVGA